MLPITQDLLCKPRQLCLNLAENTWWEVGNDGNTYMTDCSMEVYKQIIRSYKLHKEKEREICVDSVRYKYEIVAT